MNILVLLFCFFAAAVFHQSLYLVIPFISGYHILSNKRQKIQVNPVLKLYFSVVAAILFFLILQTALNLEIKTFSLKGTIRYTSYFLFVLMVSTFSLESIKRLFQIVGIYFALTLPYGVYETVVHDRYQNVFAHANHLAYVLNICIYYFAVHKPFGKGLGRFFLISLFISLVLTKSSGGLLTFLFLLLYNLFSSKAISFKMKLALVFSFFGIIGVAVTSSDKIAEQLETFNYLSWDFLEERAKQFKVGGYGSLMWRLTYWLSILLLFFSENVYSIIFGIGIDHLTLGNLPYDFMTRDPHNDFVKILVEFGIFGLVLFLFFFRTIYKITNKNVNILILTIIPMFFGNIIVNFPYNIAFILLLLYEYRSRHITTS